MKLNKKITIYGLILITITLAGAIIGAFMQSLNRINDFNSCYGEDFDYNPDIEFQLNTSTTELLQILGHVGVTNYITITDIHGTTYNIIGELAEVIKQYQGRKVLVIAKPNDESELINAIEVIEYQVLPYTLLTGNLSLITTTRMGVTTEWLILTTKVSGKEYKFQLMDTSAELVSHDSNGNVIGHLRDNCLEEEVTVSGIIGIRSYTDYQTFYLHSLCE